MIIILKNQILNCLSLISFLYGFSAITYYYPYNLFISSKINNNTRTEYEFRRKTISILVGIATPIILGGIISTTNFELTAIIVLIVSLMQIILSFFIKPIENKNYRFTPIKSLKRFIKSKDVIYMFIIDYSKGMNVSEGALEVVLTILVFNAFKTDFNLGALSSISSIVIIIIQYIYTKKYKCHNDKYILLLCSLIPIFSLLSLLFFTNNFTLLLYYFCYNTFVNLLALILDVKLFNFSNSSQIKKQNQMEFWSIREVIINLGRMTGYILLYIIARINKFNYLYYLMIFLTSSIALMSYFVSKVEKKDI